MTIYRNLKTWVEDRACNDEPLMLSEFKRFMTSMGYFPSEIDKYLGDKRIRRKIVEKHKKLRREEW